MNQNLMLQTTLHLKPENIYVDVQGEVGFISFEDSDFILYFAHERTDGEIRFNLTNLILSIQRLNTWAGRYLDINTIPFILSTFTSRDIPYTVDTTPVEVTVSPATMDSAFPCSRLQSWFDRQIGAGRVVVTKGEETTAPTTTLQNMLVKAIFELDTKIK